MKIIPVIDLKGGRVVHAKEGQREHYQPLKSKICQTDNIIQLIRAFVEKYQFDTIYIADLDAITRRGHHHELIQDILSHFPEISFWIDSGYLKPDKASKFSDNYLPVLGSESYRDDNYLEIKAFDNQFILSLDFSLLESLGSKRLFSNSDLWPNNIIIMTLDRVGSRKGPDLAKLKVFREFYPNKNFIAAGGIRHYQDLIALHKIGVTHALIASALHAGTLNSDQIMKIQAKKYPN